HTLIEQFRHSKYTLLIANSAKESLSVFTNLPANVIVENYVDQAQALQKALVFITAAGMNSINEALRAKVPMLLVPQQGEQRMIAQQVAKLGFGQCYSPRRSFKTYIELLIKKRESWNSQLSEEIVTIHGEELLLRIETLFNDSKSKNVVSK